MAFDAVHILEVKSTFAGREMLLHPVLLVDPDGATLVDTGMPGQFELLRAAIERVVGSLERVRRILLTHQDIDHIGNAARVKEASGATVSAHAADIPYIQGERPLLKANPERLRAMLASAPEEVRRQMEAVFSAPPAVHVDTALEDGQVLPIAGGLTVVATPGHTPGHISLYLPRERLLISADALTVQEGVVRGPNPTNTPDTRAAAASVRKLAGLAVDAVVAYHGGLCTQDSGAQLRALAQELA